MCTLCGCAQGKDAIVIQSPSNNIQRLMTPLLADNNHQAQHNRHHFDQHGLFALNLMSAPGSGKTSLLEMLIHSMRGVGIAVIEGDLETENDAERIRAHGVPAVQITTGTACHLNATMVHQALHGFTDVEADLLFIENVGNLVCPAAFDLGQHLNVVLLSVPEGEDKPLKYPVMFRCADAIVITKTDLLPYLRNFSIQNVRDYLNRIAVHVPVFEVNETGTGVQQLADWILAQRQHSIKPVNAHIDARAITNDAQVTQ